MRISLVPKLASVGGSQLLMEGNPPVSRVDIHAADYSAVHLTLNP